MLFVFELVRSFQLVELVVSVALLPNATIAMLMWLERIAKGTLWIQMIARVMVVWMEKRN